GLVVVPINPTYTPSEIGYMLITGDVKGIVAPEQLLPVYEQVYEQLPSIERVIICAENESACRSSFKEVSDRLVF
ncbi:long-chain fatty acid--CoA ligase, partial [Bacillus safensis]|nr:long-chain fatty acid--CoA ligase [Bacillus safensis]